MPSRATSLPSRTGVSTVGRNAGSVVLPGSITSTSVSVAPASSHPVKAGTPHAWALAATALLTHANGGSDELLGFAPVTSQVVQAEEESLKEWWGVNNREDLLAMLQWVDQGGHRQEWDRVTAYLASLDPSELSQVIAKAATDEELKHQIEMVRHYAPLLGAKSLLGWDYSRYIFLCRCGYACGYLTETEAWDRIMPVAAMLQKTFSSWQELGENYLIGREFWSYDETLKTGGAMRETYRSLLSDCSSPWKANAWGMKLGDGKSPGSA